MIDFSKNPVFKLSPVPVADILDKFQMMLIQGEDIIAAFKTIRDCVIFTNKRVISLNVQGLTGSKKDYTSIPYSKIQAFSIETAGTFDLDCEIDFWLSAVGHVRFEVKGSFDVRTFNQVISQYIL